MHEATFAALVVVLATGLRGWLDPWVGDSVPYITYYVALIVVASRSSLPVGVATSVAGWLAAFYFFLPQRFSFDLALLPEQHVATSAAYFAMSAIILFVAHRARLVQQAAARNEGHLQLVSNAVPALISYIDPERRYVSCNDEYTRWFGLPRERIIGRPVREVVGDEAWRAIGLHLDAAFRGENVEYEAESRYAHGGTRWIHVTYTPHRAADGTIEGVVAMVTDIGERKRAERHAALLADVSGAFALHGSVEEVARLTTARLLAHLGLSRCLLAEIDRDGETLQVFHDCAAPGAASQVGGYRISDFLTAEESRRLDAGHPLVIDDVREGRDTESAERFHAYGVGSVVSVPYVSDGRRKFALAAEKREPYDWKPDEIALLREVCSRLYLQLDRARSEQTLRQSERRYRHLVAVITDVPCTVDPEGRFVAPQEAWERYTGQPWERHRGFGWLDAVHPDDREPARLKWIEACRARSAYEVRARIWHAATRTFRHVVARATPVLDDGGRLVEWVGASTDVHEETLASEALREADRRKDEFLATLAHELRNPLAPIRNSLHILRLTGKADGALASVHQMLERQVKQLVRLVDDLMEVSRITRGRFELRKERIDLEAVFQSAIETSRPLLDEADHRLEVQLPPEPALLEADPVRLAQVIANLLNNAAKYTERGGRIRLAARREGRDLAISVSDNGRGIPKEMLPRVFDLFTQAKGGLDRGQGGLGIGLTIVRSLVEMHGGTIEARSEGPGRGSEFVVRLPLESQDRQVAASQAVESSPAVETRRILVVDDNRDAADSLGVLLTLLGAETRTAHDGRSALQAVDEFRPSVMLLDIGLPDLDGHEVAQRTRQHPHGRQVTIIALTGWGQERDRQRSREAGIDHHLVKPVDLEALRELLAQLPTSAEPSARRA